MTAMIRVPEFDEESTLVMVTRNGVIKRTALSAYDTARKGGVIAIDLDEGDELSWVHLTSGEDDLLVATRLGMAIRFNEKDAREMGRATRGVKAITLSEGDCVVGMAVLQPGTLVLTVSRPGSAACRRQATTARSSAAARACSTTTRAATGTSRRSRPSASTTT